MPIRAISFDLFDTLVDIAMDALPAYTLAGQPARGTQGLLYAALDAQTRGRWPIEEFVRLDAELRAKGLADGLEMLTLDRFAQLCAALGVADPRLPEALTALHMEQLFQRTSYLAHHRDVLLRLRERHRLAVCSNFSHTETAERVLRAAGLHELLDAIVVSADCGVRKPRAEIFRQLAASLRLEPAQILHVGDRLPADVGGASALGMRTAWLTRRVADVERSRSEYRGPAPDRVIADLAELLESADG
jgi:HAD superfamily hydrolase (TIGR01549 family)